MAETRDNNAELRYHVLEIRNYETETRNNKLWEFCNIHCAYIDHEYNNQYDGNGSLQFVW